MTNTREEVAVAEAIWDADDYNDYPFSQTTDDTKTHNISLAKAAIAASNSKYVPQLVAALKGLLADIEEYQTINNLGGENNHWQVAARKAINNLPEELKQ
jgi:hypothetical protein